MLAANGTPLITGQSHFGLGCRWCTSIAYVTLDNDYQPKVALLLQFLELSSFPYPECAQIILAFPEVNIFTRFAHLRLMRDNTSSAEHD